MMKLTLAALGCAALMALGAPEAHADVVTFDANDIEFVGDGGTINSQGFVFTQIGDFGGVTDAVSFVFNNAPTGNATRFYGALNDTSVRLTHQSRAFNISGLDFGFVPALDQVFGLGDNYGGIVLDAVAVDGSTITAFADFGSADAGGLFAFQTVGAAGLGALSSVYLNSLTFTACAFDNGNCVAPNVNFNQFAIDNLVLAIPEPGSLALAALALCGAGFARRRQVR